MSASSLLGVGNSLSPPFLLSGSVALLSSGSVTVGVPGLTASAVILLSFTGAAQNLTLTNNAPGAQTFTVANGTATAGTLTWLVLKH
jgi:hypothetical protein